MKIVFAQGNPGREYTHTRHNIGFIVVDALAKELGVEFIHKAKFQADIAETTLHCEKILIVKPTTFYNDTGQAARQLLDFYKLDPATDFVVVHDELALPLGTIRTRLSGSDAGNNGIKSLNAHLGTQHARIRIGVYAPLRDQISDTDFVIGKFNADEQEKLPDIIKQAQTFIEQFVSGTFAPTKVTV